MSRRFEFKDLKFINYWKLLHSILKRIYKIWESRFLPSASMQNQTFVFVSQFSAWMDSKALSYGNFSKCRPTHQKIFTLNPVPKYGIHTLNNNSRGTESIWVLFFHFQSWFKQKGLRIWSKECLSCWASIGNLIILSFSCFIQIESENISALSYFSELIIYISSNY